MLHIVVCSQPSLGTAQHTEGQLPIPPQYRLRDMLTTG